MQSASSQAKQFILTGNPVPSAPSFKDEAPPPYNTLPPDSSQFPQEGSFNALTFEMMGGNEHTCEVIRIGQGSKLGYMDFMPRMLHKRRFKDNVYESFR